MSVSGIKIVTEYRVKRVRWLLLFSRTVLEKRILWAGEFVTAVFDWREINPADLAEGVILSQVSA